MNKRLQLLRMKTSGTELNTALTWDLVPAQGGREGGLDLGVARHLGVVSHIVTL